ncbi:uncharacterized protein LOC131939747 [Physella acuta]|uniref:uncharacterized protein LOC131939747 n=1 Tax=Physella acuta TaxID=109671 RepID=UPI0027DC03B4|nr:uncharacterized protein LOC131939747 [Physella acuta]
MATEIQNVGLDDLMASLMSMGFEFNDCQDAITNGKLTVQAAIDWILAGKPDNVAATHPSLKLNRNQGQLAGGSSNPFVQGNVNSLRVTTAAEISSSEAMGVDVSDETIISRSHLSEKQQHIKQNFEEKERLEAKRLANEEKKKKKIERERILKEIQEDREKVKLTKHLKTEHPNPQATVQSATTSHGAVTPTEAPGGEEGGARATSIQVRLPSGQMFRESFPVTATLNSVWDAVYNQIKTAINAHSGFIQPFPRREFLREEMNQTLTELGLVPSGSLVLKKKDVQQATPQNVSTMQSPTIMRALEQFEADEDDEDDDEEGRNNMAIPAEHQWGRGFVVEGDDEPMDVGEDNAQHAVQNALNDFLGMGGPNFQGGGRHRVFEGFGNRLVPEGVPGDNNVHLSRRAPEMAAEAATSRSAQPPQPALTEPRLSNHHPDHFYHVRSLQDMSMQSLARRLTDPRNPIFSMSGLSEELLQKFISYLMKEHLLKPKLLYLMPSYLIKLVLDYYPYTTNELIHSVRVFVNLQILSLNSCTLITDGGLNSIKGLKYLKVLNLSGCSQLTNACFSVIQELQNLQTLNLEGTGVSDAGVIQFAASSSCTQLQHLDLSRTTVTQDVFQSLQNFTKLKSLYLKQTKINSLAGIEGIVTLENLDISDTHIVTDSVLCLTRLPHLSHISLTGTQEVNGDQALYYLKDMKITGLFLPSRITTSDTGLAYISGFQLSALDLTNYTNVGDQGMVHLGKMTSLKKLLLSNTKVTDEGLKHLSGLVNLEVLLLDRTQVSNAGAMIVCNFKLLNELSLSATSITSDFLIQGCLNKCMNLTKLNLSRTIIKDNGISNLKLPNLLLLNLDCTRVHPYSEGTIRANCPNIKSVTIANLSSLMEDEEN